jgi:hypothetical protein
MKVDKKWTKYYNLSTKAEFPGFESLPLRHLIKNPHLWGFFIKMTVVVDEAEIG